MQMATHSENVIMIALYCRHKNIC